MIRIDGFLIPGDQQFKEFLGIVNLNRVAVAVQHKEIVVVFSECPHKADRLGVSTEDVFSVNKDHP